MLDEQFVDAVAGALTAQDFILQNLYAIVLARAPDPLAACQRTAREFLQKFEDLPPTNAGEAPGDKEFRIRQHALYRLERFWTNVEVRLQKYVDQQR